MKILCADTYTRTPRDIIRKCGYGELRKYHSGQMSYVKRIAGQEFPRFHVYIELIEGGFTFNLHLDQKAATYSGCSAHSGEYDGDVVTGEGERIKRNVDEYKT